jgi:hypothetical protein
MGQGTDGIAAHDSGAGPLVDLGTLGGPNSGADGPNLYGEAAVDSEIAKADPDHEDFCGYATTILSTFPPPPPAHPLDPGANKAR